MDGRRSKRQTKIDANPPVPLASYGIKIYGRGYEAWPSRYNEAFSTIMGSTCDCSTAEVIHSEYQSVLRGMDIITDLPYITDGENNVENIQQAREIPGENAQLAREIQQRAIALYEQTIANEDSTGPTEAKWRQDIENRVFGHFEQSSFQEFGRGRIRINSRQDFHTQDVFAANISSSPALIFERGRRSSEVDHGTSSLPRAIADRSLANLSIAYPRQPTQLPALNTNERHNASSSGSRGDIYVDLTSPVPPSHARSSSYCPSSLNESQQRRYFASGVECAILEDDLDVNAYQGDQKPDRIIGLATSNSAYAYNGPQREVDIGHQHLRQLKLERGVNLSAFKNGEFNPLILPFVILEAKRAHGTYWPKLENQTGLPVAKFLRQQINLQLESGRKPNECNTLVWMFGVIGSEWHVYGCYAVWYRITKKWHFKIVQLVSMDIRVEKEAIRLLNIVDFIASWGRVFRQNVIEDIGKIPI